MLLLSGLGLIPNSRFKGKISSFYTILKGVCVLIGKFGNIEIAMGKTTTKLVWDKNNVG